MKRNGLEYVEIGLAGHSRLDIGTRGSGVASITHACNAWFEDNGLPRSESRFSATARAEIAELRAKKKREEGR